MNPMKTYPPTRAARRLAQHVRDDHAGKRRSPPRRLDRLADTLEAVAAEVDRLADKLPASGEAALSRSLPPPDPARTDAHAPLHGAGPPVRHGAKRRRAVGNERVRRPRGEKFSATFGAGEAAGGAWARRGLRL